jgi:hypothetical protein
MRRILITAPLVTIMAALLGTALATPASAAGHRIYLAANGANPTSAAVEPRSAPISRDSSFALSDLVWTSWAERAAGTGTATLNLCDPDCATGHLIRVPVTVSLGDPRTVCGREFFTSLQLTLTGSVPAGLTRSTSVPIAPYC